MRFGAGGNNGQLNKTHMPIWPQNPLQDGWRRTIRSGLGRVLVLLNVFILLSTTWVVYICIKRDIETCKRWTLWFS